MNVFEECVFHHIYIDVISAIPLLLIQKYLPCFQMAVKEQGEGLGGRGSEEGAAGC